MFLSKYLRSKIDSLRFGWAIDLDVLLDVFSVGGPKLLHESVNSILRKIRASYARRGKSIAARTSNSLTHRPTCFRHFLYIPDRERLRGETSNTEEKRLNLLTRNAPDSIIPAMPTARQRWRLNKFTRHNFQSQSERRSSQEAVLAPSRAVDTSSGVCRSRWWCLERNLLKFESVVVTEFQWFLRFPASKPK